MFFIDKGHYALILRLVQEPHVYPAGVIAVPPF